MNFEKLFLTDEDVQFIHEQSVKVLEEAGCIFDEERALEVFRKAGAKVDGSTVHFTRELIEKALKTAEINTFEMIRPDGSVYEMGRGINTMATAGSPPYIMQDGQFRFATMDDYIKICKLVQTSDCIDLTHLLLCDTYDVDRDERAYHMVSALLKYTTLPISLTALATSRHDSGVVARNVVNIIQDFIGVKDKHVAIGCVSPISPLAYVKDALDALFTYCEMNQPIQLAVCSLPVLTSQASIIGTLVQNNAELLAAIVLIQLVKPGLPIFYGNTSTSTSLRNVSMALGSAETALISLCTAAMAKFYKLPFRASGALNDAIDIDYQAGAESMLTLMSGIMSDVSLAFFSCGMLSGFNVTSLEKYVVDEQIIKMLLRMKKGFMLDRTKDYTKDIIKVGPRGNYLTGRTPKEYRKEHFVPDLFIKVDYNTWQTEDGKSVKQKAEQKVRERLEKYQAPDITKDQLKVIEKYL